MNMLMSAAAAAVVFAASPAAAQNCVPVAEKAAAMPELSTLVELVGAAGVTDALNGVDAALTLFAPSNAAFEAVGTVDELSEDPFRLAQILANHIVPTGALLAEDLADGQQLSTIGSDEITVMYGDDGTIMVGLPGGAAAAVTTADIVACEGVIHVVDTVLLVGDAPVAPLDEDVDMLMAVAPAPTEAANCTTITDVALATPDLSTLVDAVIAADILEVLDDMTAEYTVFAPTNAAFAAVGTLEELTADTDALTAVLSDHVVVGTFKAADLTDGQTLTTLAGTTLMVRIVEGAVTITAPASGSIATVSAADIAACDSIVHVINAVLLAGEGAGQTMTGTRELAPPSSGASGIALGGAAMLAALIAAVL